LAFTVAVTVAALTDLQVTPLEVYHACTVTDLGPASLPLTVYEQLPVPLCEPAGLPFQV
jgi:hypothetical protein